MSELFLIVAGLVSTAVLLVAYLTNIVISVITGSWLMLAAGVAIPPVGIINGIGHIFGFW